FRPLSPAVKKLTSILGARGFIVPDEIPTILSVIYSNIPVLKKGTDSRLGWGFRLGDRADFQVLVELGPQTYTQPLANQGDSGNSKRNTINSLSDALYAQRQKEKLISNTDGGKWLEDWSNNAQKKKESNDIPSGARPGIAIGEIDAKSVIPDDSMQKFAQLYKEKSAHTLIVPDDVLSVLHVIHANIPQFKKGTDSRFGWGFRVGDRADFQIMLELGPQKFTQPLANQMASGNSKRDTIHRLSDTLYARRQKDKQISTERRKWLENWSSSVQKETDNLPSGARQGTPDDSTLELESQSATAPEKNIKLRRRRK
ncbi:uncharacterized protein BDFB_010759, partial [Asbolus verrucosus]